MKETHTIREAFLQASSFLRDAKNANPNFEAEWIIRRLLNWDRSRFYSDWGDPWPYSLSNTLLQWLERRSEGEPLQYIIGDQEFYGRLFHVNSAVLIPRPETELLVEGVISESQKIWGDTPLSVVEVGTGSGAIAVTLAMECPNWSITTIDISKKAIQVARGNANRYGVEGQIEWLHGEYLNPLKIEKPTIDLLISNPPYIPSEEISRLEEQVRNYEPHLALDGGKDGMDPYRMMVQQLSEWNPAKRMIAFEIGSNQGDAVASIMHQSRFIDRIEVRKDWANYDRMVFGWTT